MVSESRRAAFHAYVNEFESTYLLESTGQQHLAGYEKERGEVRRSWIEIKQAKQQHLPITDMVLAKLLPYSNTVYNREQGHRISVTPAITRDLKKWFENAGWQRSDNWDNVASAIYDVVYGLVERHDWGSLAAFEANQAVSKGIRAGFLTPTFHFLNGQYRTINGKTIDTVNFLLERAAIDRDLAHYREYLDVIAGAIEDLSIPLLADADVFDAFCHWMCDRRLGGYARIEKPVPEEVTGIDEVVEEVEEQGPASFELEAEPTNHWEAIYYLVKLGNCLGYKTYVADPAKTAYNARLGDIATLKETPSILTNAREIHRVDVIWYRPTHPFFFFEVEDGGTMRDALHRLYNLMAFDARFVIISPIHNRDKFEKWVRTEPFHEFEDRYNFRTYPELFEFYREAAQFVSMRERFLRM